MDIVKNEPVKEFLASISALLQLHLSAMAASTVGRYQVISSDKIEQADQGYKRNCGSINGN